MAEKSRSQKATVLDGSRRIVSLIVWGPAQTYLGYLLLLVLASVIFGFLNEVIEKEWFTHNNVTRGGIILLSVVYFYLMALAKVKEAHVGQPTLLGARMKKLVLPEGYALILPWPIMGYSEIPLQPATTELKDPMEILVSRQPETNNSGTQLAANNQRNPDEPLYQVRMKISMSILWKPDQDELWNYTSVEGGKTGVEKQLVELMRRTIREKAQHMSDTQVLTGQELFEKAIWDELTKNKLHQDRSGRTMTLAELLGISPIKVQTTKIVPSDEELTKKYERLRGEDLDRQAEAKQAAHIIKNIALPFKNDLGVDGDVALHSALAITKDARLNVVTGNAGDFTKGQVAGNQGGK